jgi:transglutaminase-like putative cysteine protease
MNCSNETDPKRIAISLFNAVRDRIIYDPYRFNLKPEHLKASYIQSQKRAFCIQKAVLLAAAARAANIPSRLGFADLINHLMGEDLKQLLQTNLVAFHGYVELYIDNQWLKATPVFDKNLCRYLNIPVVDFDAENHAIFPLKDKDGNLFMEYIKYHGTFSDIPLEMIVHSIKQYYPQLMEKNELI